MIGDRRLREAFADQARACRSLGSPFMGRLCDLLSQRLRRGTPLTDRLFDWEGMLGPQDASVPLRLCGALHALRLNGHAGLDAVYPPATAKPSELWAAVEGALTSEADFIARFIDSAPQMNEVRRSAAIIPAAHVAAARFPLPFDVAELGASAGLNLIWDRFRLQAGEVVLGPDAPVLDLAPHWTGPVPVKQDISVVRREGVDLNPLDPGDPDDRLRLMAYLWPDQPDRLALTQAAIAAAGAKVTRADAIDWLERWLLRPSEGRLRFIYSTIAWQYFPPAAQVRGTRLIEAAGARARTDAPLAWFSMESDGSQPGAVLTLRLWPGDQVLALGRADFHGRWIDWSGRA